MSTTIGSPYDAVGLFADAFKRAGSIEPAATIKALEQTKGFTGAVGDYSFSPERHHSVGPADLGLFEYVREDGRIKLKPVAG
jgi:ABC-type branched-subunit amino acid transport system substrate-binding protein